MKEITHISDIYLHSKLNLQKLIPFLKGQTCNKILMYAYISVAWCLIKQKDNLNPEDEGSMYLWNFSNTVHIQTVQIHKSSMNISIITQSTNVSHQVSNNLLSNILVYLAFHIMSFTMFKTYFNISSPNSYLIAWSHILNISLRRFVWHFI